MFLKIAPFSSHFSSSQEIQGVENGQLAVPVINTLVRHVYSFLGHWHTKVCLDNAKDITYLYLLLQIHSIIATYKECWRGVLFTVVKLFYLHDCASGVKFIMTDSCLWSTPVTSAHL